MTTLPSNTSTRWRVCLMAILCTGLCATPASPDTLEHTIKYVWNVESDGIRHSFSGDRDIRVRAAYDAARSRQREAQSGSLDNNLRYYVFKESLAISSEDLKRDPVGALSRLKSRLLEPLSRWGVSDISILYFQEGAQVYRAAVPRVEAQQPLESRSALYGRLWDGSGAGARPIAEGYVFALSSDEKRILGYSRTIRERGPDQGAWQIGGLPGTGEVYLVDRKSVV